MKIAATKPHFRKPEYWFALCAVCLVSICYYGLRAAVLTGLAVFSAVLTDFFCLFLQNRSYRKIDISNIAPAIVMTLMFPAGVPYYVVVLASVFTVAVGMHVFGSRGNYVFPPAAVGYLFAFICWKNEFLSAPQAGVHLPILENQEITEVQSTLSSRFNAEGVLSADQFDLLIGNVVSPMGTGCILLLAVVLIILLLRSSVSCWSVAGFLFGISFLANFGNVPTVYYLVVNMVLFSMIFLIGDPLLIPDGRLSLLFGSAVTGMLTYYLMAVHSLEYAPVVAVMLTCPFWHILSDIEERIGEKLDAMELAAKQKMTQDDVPADTEVLHETE